MKYNLTLKTLIAAGTMALAITAVGAQVTVASISNRPGDVKNYYSYKQSGGTGTFFTSPDLGVTNATVPVTFAFNIPVPQFTNPIQASVFFGMSSLGACTSVGGKTTQELNGGTLSVFVSPNDPNYGDNGSISHHGSELIFKATYQTAGLSQDTTAGNPNPTFGFQDPSDVVVFQSAYFGSSSPRTGTFSFASGGNFNCVGGVLQSGTFGGDGNFASAAAGATVPEPGVVAMLLGTGVAGTLVFMRRRKRN